MALAECHALPGMPDQSCQSMQRSARTCSGFISSSRVLEMPRSKALPLSCGKIGPATVPSWSARLLNVLGIVCITCEGPCSDEACIAFQNVSRGHRALVLLHTCAGQTFGHARTCPINWQGRFPPKVGRPPEEVIPFPHLRREAICHLCRLDRRDGFEGSASCHTCCKPWSGLGHGR